MTRFYLGDKYVMTESGQIDILYFILSENPAGSKAKHYGLQIISLANNKTENLEIRNIFDNYNICRKTIMRLKQNTVTTVTAKEIIFDMVKSDHDMSSAFRLTGCI